MKLPHVQSIVQSLLAQSILLPFDIVFAQKHLAQASSSNAEAEAFLAAASALLRCGYPYFAIHKDTINPTLPGVSNKLLFQWFQALPSDTKEMLFEVVDNKIYLRSLFLLREQVFQKLRILAEATPRTPLCFKTISQLSEEQNFVLEQVLKSCFSLVCGGPGTGKSVLAINLLSKLTNEEQFCQYVSKNQAPRSVYLEKLKGSMKKSSVDNLFKGSGCYIDLPENIIDTLIVDEAHRLNEKSGMFKNKGENQIKEIIHASKCSVFFIDEHQRVTLSDIGSTQEIEKWAFQQNAIVTHLKLESQFRCNGSDGYLSWLDHTLEIRQTANIDLEDIDFDFQICDSAIELKNKIEEKNQINNKSRIVAGYCWDWLKDYQNDTNVYDIVIDDFKMSWNLKNSIFALDETSIHEVGCIHTCQGLEFDYVGVIIGEDMRYEDHHIVTDFTKRAKTDQSLKGIKKLAKKDLNKANQIADEIIKNTYRTLMTRGMKGCYVYCVDQQLNNYLKQNIKRG